MKEKKKHKSIITTTCFLFFGSDTLLLHQSKTEVLCVNMCALQQRERKRAKRGTGVCSLWSLETQEANALLFYSHFFSISVRFSSCINNIIGTMLLISFTIFITVILLNARYKISTNCLSSSKATFALRFSRIVLHSEYHCIDSIDAQIFSNRVYTESTCFVYIYIYYRQSVCVSFGIYSETNYTECLLQQCVCFSSLAWYHHILYFLPSLKLIFFSFFFLFFFFFYIP